ncbi:hypothetical protein BO85DRAFT_445268 [Aspergillus piperis CBS 112811]|uniref:Uncharacterized protein n=1 Tax=Aspergillus piperis CBS 112811 TaxID=1448313 RepID=A0A8G1VRG0_9EURO|nr:hypothetical protein BO85DRAFT_445268 [Aspergillus piperis CBS 112811]RAH61865.1 hypothetical protein BO85DRAFT_445268 [Aspergillus piperis CBS 112811]
MSLICKRFAYLFQSLLLAVIIGIFLVKGRVKPPVHRLGHYRKVRCALPAGLRQLRHFQTPTEEIFSSQELS